MIELVVKLPEGAFELLKTKGVDWLGAEHILSAVAEGTPLPKGHGRLIDADALEECKEIMNTISGESKYAVRMDDIRNMPTIIEADEEGAEE